MISAMLTKFSRGKRRSLVSTANFLYKITAYRHRDFHNKTYSIISKYFFCL